ncbi:MAG TPA: hypothetical protein PKK26_03640, partial [Candidatus Wallbacteria bacterium]|nr:hypothetical protein [Candidatus Wallbacteria bacterium]
PQIGLLCGTILLIALKFISFISDPDIYRTFFRTFIAAKTQDQKSKSETAHDAAVTSLLTVLAVSIMLSALCGMPHRAFAADLKSNELYYNPSTLEVQLFQLNGLDRFFSKRYSKGVFVKYADLKFLLDSVSAIDKGGASIKLPESAVEPERAPYKNLVKKMLISCNATAGNADIDIEYLIDIFDDDYTSVRLFSGNIALTGVSSRLIRTFAGTSEIAVSGYDAVRILPFKDTYSAVFGGPGEYLVKVSLKADIAADKDDRYFDIAPGKCPAMKINLRTPAGYDISASGLIIESQKQESSTSEIATSANLIPADFYRFRLTLQEKIRNEKYRKQRELEERAKKARELIARSEAVKSVIPKSEPRTAVNSVQILTVEEERFSSVITLNYNIENTELRDLRFKIRPETLITRVGSSAEISDWKIADAADAADAADDKQNKILCVTFRTPQKGRLDLTIDFEHVIADMKREAEAPWLIPQAVDENVLYLALDSAVNADLSVTRTENLTAIDEREIPGGLKRNTLSPVLFSYKTSKFPCALALSIKKNTDLPSIPCVIDSAAYKSFVTKAGYVLTSARYQVRNNNVQFLRMRLPESSKAWSLKVGERLVKPAKNDEGSIFIPLLKSPLIDNEFKAFSVELVYLSKFPEFGDFGGARFSIPMIEVMCSRISWEFYFMDSYQISGIRANLRRSAAAGAAGFMDGGSGKALSVEEMLAVQDKMKAAYLAGGLDDPGMNSEGVSGVFPSSLPQFGGNVRGFLPVSTEFPELATNALFFSGENLKRSEGFDNAPLFFIEFNFYSNKVFEFLAIAGYIMGVLLAVWAASAIFKTKKYRRLIICGSISFIYCLIVFQYNENSMNYLFAGFSMGIIFILAGFAARPAKRAGQ